MIASSGSYGNGGDGHMHQPTPGRNTGDVVCSICGVPLRSVALDVRRGFGAIAAVVDGVVGENAFGEPAEDPREAPRNRKERRAKAARARGRSVNSS